ncbi:MAG: hypothetical protein HY748_00395 [Elusimicrobia bacterium]|nr:hypothetical protein [Elusimicrobiota bacterium]
MASRIRQANGDDYPEAALKTFVSQNSTIERVALIDDLFGKMRLVFWARSDSQDATRQELRQKLDAALKAVGSAFWTGEAWDATKAEAADRIVYDKAWSEGRGVSGSDKVRTTDRRRNRGAWFESLSEPPWIPQREEGEQAPPILVFYSFKGGVGRSTTLAAFAIQRARLGERVAVVDLDLDAPGVGSLIAADEKGTIARWGGLDYLLERPLESVDLRDYYHACRRREITGSGEILVVPAGTLDDLYLSKLARADFEPPPPQDKHVLTQLFEQIRTELNPHWLLLDARTGLSEPSGALLGGMAHLHVLFGTTSQQTWQGLKLVLGRIGADRVLENKAQLDCLLVQAMVPEDSKAATTSKAVFSDLARDAFSECYYAPDPADTEEDRFWYVRDMEASDAPHAPIAISYDQKLAHFDKLEDVADHLAQSPEYMMLAERIAARFPGRTKE